MNTINLRRKYKWIVLWGGLMGSYTYYIDEQLYKAEATNAPETATYQKQDGSWNTIDDIKNEDTRFALGLEPLIKNDDTKE